jgi:hypothetical protein
MGFEKHKGEMDDGVVIVTKRLGEVCC